ncbi:MAG: type II toxin-antitoxin system CcdA family antitoxin [Armatimonadota bacterium]|jgi:post-segregation antitoxin (ccd killing protein)
MASKSIRISAVLERPLHERLVETARASGVSLSRRVRDLLEAALDAEEDAYWVREGEKRLATWDDSKALTHDEAWR